MRFLPVLGLLLLGFTGAHAGTDTLLTIGEHKFSLDRVQRMLDETPGKLVAALGSSQESRKRKFVEELVVPRLLQEVAAVSSFGGSNPRARGRRDKVLSRQLEDQIAAGITIEDREIEAFYQEHRAEYERPLAISIWRILVQDEQAARAIIEQVKDRADGVEVWWKLAREQSLDDATKYRYGALGFVQRSGQTDVPQVRVRQELFAAASGVKDGELVLEPVTVGDHFAVVWRRGTRPEEQRSLVRERETIRAILVRDRARAARDDLVRSLRQQQAVEQHDELLESIEYPKARAVSATRSPRAPRAAEATARPASGPRGDR